MRTSPRRLSSVLVTGLVALALSAASLPARAQEVAPDFTLVNQDGAKIRLSQLRGRLVLLSFIYTHCVDICPLTTAKLVKVQNELKTRGWFGPKVVLLSMTFDPQRDTPAVLRAYAQKFRVDRRGWHFLSGEPAAVMKVIRAYRIPVRPAAKPGLIDHGLPILVIDRLGRILGNYEPDFDPQNVVKDLAYLLGV